MLWISDEWKDYQVLDTSGGERLERWGKFILVRPDPQVIWNSPRENRLWAQPGARYVRSRTGGGKWQTFKRIPAVWQVRYKDLTFNIKTMGFKHTGLFPEQAVNWDLVRGMIERAERPVKVLNLFAYTGGATVACLKSGGQRRTRPPPAWQTALCAGLWTIVSSLCSEKFAGATGTTL